MSFLRGETARYGDGEFSLWRPLLAVLALTLVVLPSLSVGQAQASTRSTAGSACAPFVVNGVIPAWASQGFHPAKFRMHYELGKSDKIVALLWKFPLLAPPSQTEANKILWVSHVFVSGSPLLISAQRMVGTKPIGKAVRLSIVGGPGPSYVNMPTAGCWRLNLRWSGHADRLDLRYVDNP